jgi:hypothetical protein
MHFAWTRKSYKKPALVINDEEVLGEDYEEQLLDPGLLVRDNFSGSSSG